MRVLGVTKKYKVGYSLLFIHIALYFICPPLGMSAYIKFLEFTRFFKFLILLISCANPDFFPLGKREGVRRIVLFALYGISEVFLGILFYPCQFSKVEFSRGKIPLDTHMTDVLFCDMLKVTHNTKIKIKSEVRF